MIQLIYSPTWFRGFDILIDSFSMLVILLIAFFSIKCYKISKKNKNYVYLAASFILIAMSFLFKILTNLTFYSRILETKKIGLITYTYQIIKPNYLLPFASSILQKSLMLIGLYFLYVVLDKNKSRIDHVLTVCLLLIITHLSHIRHFFFYLTAFILLIVIILKYYFSYKKNKQKTTRLLMYSFSIIALSQLLFLFILKYSIFYVIAEIVQVIGYLLLLVTFVMVLRYGKKKK